MPKPRARQNIRKKKQARARIKNQALRKTLAAPAKPAAKTKTTTKPAAAAKAAPAK
jgi:hypothetical protein